MIVLVTHSDGSRSVHVNVDRIQDLDQTYVEFIALDQEGNDRSVGEARTAISAVQILPNPDKEVDH